MVVGRRTLELALDYRCNLRCVGCHACDGTGETMSSTRAAGRLREGFASGAREVWFGGGEPTLRDDLLPLIKRARDLGYERVVVQTNGLRLAYPAYAQALLDAGVTEVRVNAKSARADVHDTLCSAPGSHALLVRALGNLSGAHVAADVLLTTSTIPHLDETLIFFADRGVRRFALWLLHAGDTAADGDVVAREVPRIAELHDPLARAGDAAKARGIELVSFHTPPCTLPAPLRPLWQPAGELGMTVVDPGGHAFALEESPFEGGGHLPGCRGCREADRCRGPRTDYVRLHGAAEFRALGSTEG
jgi:MoaA/NifB/PqqE/SkfB family radical SAM enzyme